MTAMNLADVLTAVRTRLIASAAIGTHARGHFHQRATPDVGPSVGALPYTVFYCGAEWDDTFTSNEYRVTLTVSIIDHAENGDDNLNTLLGRVVGDSDPATDTAPTYGLHRHHLQNTGDNIAGMIVGQSIQPLYMDDPFAIGWIVVFALRHEQGEES